MFVRCVHSAKEGTSGIALQNKKKNQKRKKKRKERRKKRREKKGNERNVLTCLSRKRNILITVKQVAKTEPKKLTGTHLHTFHLWKVELKSTWHACIEQWRRVIYSWKALDLCTSNSISSGMLVMEYGQLVRGVYWVFYNRLDWIGLDLLMKLSL